MSSGTRVISCGDSRLKAGAISDRDYRFII